MRSDRSGKELAAAVSALEKQGLASVADMADLGDRTKKLDEATAVLRNEVAAVRTRSEEIDRVASTLSNDVPGIAAEITDLRARMEKEGKPGSILQLVKTSSEWKTLAKTMAQNAGTVSRLKDRIAVSEKQITTIRYKTNSSLYRVLWSS